MAIETADIRGALVYRSVEYPWRWYDAIGENVLKWSSHFVNLPRDDTTLDPTEFLDTVVEVGTGTSTAVCDVEAGGLLLMTCAGNENDGIQLQMPGEAILLDADYNTYFGVRYRVTDADQMDWLLGLFITDTTAIDGGTDGMYFRSVDAAATCQFVCEKDSVESSTSVATVTDLAYNIMEFNYDGTNVKAYVNGTLMATVADSSASFPNDEELTLTLAVLTGEAVVGNVMELDWVRLFQIR